MVHRFLTELEVSVDMKPVKSFFISILFAAILVACGDNEAVGGQVVDLSIVSRQVADSTPLPVPSEAPKSRSTLSIPEVGETSRNVLNGMKVVVVEGSVSRYLVQEQLARLNVPNDATGSTGQIKGHINFDSGGMVEDQDSRVVVDLRTLRSDKTRRDEYLRTRTFESDKFPFASFVIREARSLQWPLPTVGEMAFQLIGDMTIHGVTAPLIWDVDLWIRPEGANAKARTSFPFSAFDMDIPSLFFIISVEDNIRLELDLLLDIVP